MQKEKRIGFILAFCFILGATWFIGCATTEKSAQREAPAGEVADINQLLGLADKKASKETVEKKTEEKNSTIPEDEVLKLLGVSEKEKTTPTKTETTKIGLGSEVQSLEAKEAALANKEKSLKEKVLQQEREIASIKSSTKKTTPVWKSSSFAERYQEARQDYLNRHYREAIQKFEALLDIDTQNSLSDNCQYWIGECYYGLGNYQQAIIAFEKVFSFPQSNKDDAAQLKLGLCYMRLNDKKRAKAELQKLIDNYPTSEFVSIAKRLITKIGG